MSEPQTSNAKSRIDPTSLLPEEPMSYEIKKKKKKKKKKKDLEDPLGGQTIEVTVEEPVKIEYDYDPILDPEVTIKEENIEVDLDFNDYGVDHFMSSDDVNAPTNEENQENPENPDAPIEFNNVIKSEACILTFQNIIRDVKKTHKKQKMQKMCSICHLVFKTNRTLRMHQLKKHNLYRPSFVHSCDHCGMAYEHKTSLETHIRRKHSKDALPEDNEQRVCEICALVFKGMPRLRMHMQRKHGTYSDTFKHKCYDCGLTYDKYHSLLVHRRRKHVVVKEKRSSWYKCPLCPKIFKQRDAYSRHVIRTHHSEREEKVPKEVLDGLTDGINMSLKEIPCLHCPLVFSSGMYLKLHMRRKHNEFKEDFQLKCVICDLSYDKVESLKRHIRRKHTGCTFCDICKKQFQSEEEFANHSHEKTIIECTICGLIFASQGGLGKHMRCTHKIDKPKTVFCHLCKEGFHENRQLKVHIMRVHLNVNYPCKHCKKVFKTRPSFRRHCMRYHAVNNPSENMEYNCTVCPETFTSEHELCRHINAAHKRQDTKIKSEGEVKVEIESYQCTKCEHASPTWHELREHYVQNHHNLPSIQCQSCGEFILEKDLPKHMKSKHPVETVQKCPYCDFETTSKSSLTQHTLRHKNASTITCEYQGCKYKSFYQLAMDKHKKRHAEIGVKLQCASCPFQTMNKYILRYHEEEHATGEKRYACDQCDYRTILPANLVQHKYKHASEKRFKCESCPFATKYNTSLRFHVRKKHCDLPS